MLSKRNFAMMMIMNLVVLVLFLFSAVLKEYFNGYSFIFLASRASIIGMILVLAL